ncbi:Bacteriophage lambda integrase, N-terminal domain [Leclercia adecarboxylata]|uniref:Bacteriophage lambda integrase, N-terminal domain n=1 Tax=Leclercia adecarboxylata TaxID=83655 RepID=A0A4U9I0B3_9ENTR|nr:Bacteriophage lambda integrase, N-terminal domain [Leclercia adecarboxylata]
MAKRPVRYDANLPRNLTYRKRDRLYSWRNPTTGQEISLGRIDRKDAVAQAIEANNYIDQNYLPSSLLDRIKDAPTFTVSAWLERYEVILERRELKPNTMKVRRNQIATINDEFGRTPLSSVSTKDISNFLESYILLRQEEHGSRFAFGTPGHIQGGNRGGTYRKEPGGTDTNADAEG